jgi:hypothetical protein
MTKPRIWLLTALAVLGSACDSGSDTLTVPGSGGGGGGGGGAPPVVVRMGSGFGASFQQGMLQIGVSTLSAGGTTGISASFVNATGNLHTESVEVAFNSPCVAQGLATVTTPVTTTTGIANTTYVASGCSGGDVITATATVNGTTLTATGTVTVAAPSVGSIQFISATPTNIGLRGTGGAGRAETSTVIFRVVDSTGGPVPNVDVTFALNTSVGGLAVTPAAPAVARTNFDGRAQATVTSGTIATTVRVAATVAGSGISTQSDQLTITTGIPDQDSVSLSVETLNPDAWAFDGTADPVTIRLSDRFNNPVPDGTAVTFTSEGAQIGSQCLTTDGACSVIWTSQNPRPANGRVTVLATATGEESFVDVNGNGTFNAGDTFTDIGEPFRDDDESGTRQANEPFLDFGGANTASPNGSHDGPNGLFNGLLCTGASCGVASTVAVSGSGVISMSGCDLDTSFFPAVINTSADLTGIPYQDLRGNPLPALSTIAFSVTNGTLTGGNTRTTPNTLAVQTYAVSVAATAGGPPTGALTITVTCPRSTGVILSIPLND